MFIVDSLAGGLLRSRPLDRLIGDLAGEAQVEMVHQAMTKARVTGLILEVEKDVDARMHSAQVCGCAAKLSWDVAKSKLDIIIIVIVELAKSRFPLGRVACHPVLTQAINLLDQESISRQKYIYIISITSFELKFHNKFKTYIQ